METTFVCCGWQCVSNMFNRLLSHHLKTHTRTHTASSRTIAPRIKLFFLVFNFVCSATGWVVDFLGWFLRGCYMQ